MGLLIRYLKKMAEGACCYKKIMKKYKLDKNKNHILLIAEDNKEFCHYALAHVNDYVQKKYIESVAIATDSQEVLDAVDSRKIKCCAKIKLSKAMADSLILYAHSLAYTNINVLSLTKPEENRNAYLLDMGKVAIEDIVCYCNYNLFSYTKDAE